MSDNMDEPICCTCDIVTDEGNGQEGHKTGCPTILSSMDRACQEATSRFGPGKMAPEGLGKIKILPDEEELSRQFLKGIRPATPSREFLIALGFLSYIKADISRENCEMLADIIRCERGLYNG